MSSAKYRIEPGSDYLQVKCEECGERCEFVITSTTPGLKVKIDCPKCGSSGEWKLDGYSAATSKRAQIPHFDS
jgi:ribosomal protein S27E